MQVRFPSAVRACCELALYFCALAVPVALSRLEGGVAFIWLGTALLIAKLAATPRAGWPPILFACAAASAVVTCIWGVGVAPALPLAFVNIGEAVLGMEIMRRFGGAGDPGTSPRTFAIFFVATGIVAPATSGLAGAMIVHLATDTSFLNNWWHWYTGHALGALTLAPIATFFTRGQVRRWSRQAKAKKRLETAALMLLVAAVSAGVFMQSSRPILFLPLLPLMLATFRAGRFGAAMGVVIIAIVGGALTLLGRGPITLMDADSGERLHFFQFYLAASVLMILPVAVSLAHRKQLFSQLRDSEARYRLVTDNSTDIVMNLGVDGSIRFVSPSISQFGFSPDALIGTSAAALVDEGYRPAVRSVHQQALANPGRMFIVSYEVTGADGVVRWFESHTRSVGAEDGAASGVVTSVRDISHRKAIEQRLERAANTDPLTGLANRRLLCETLHALTDRAGPLGRPGCLAIIDIDHFKSVNDTYGHDAGDRVLKDFAAIARTVIRDGDLLTRLGGEEFALILPGATTAQAMLVCDRLRAATAERRFEIGARRSIRITVSGGIATFAAGDVTDDVLRAADVALYRAKTAGRDRLALAA